MNKTNRKYIGLAIAAVISFCCICVAFAFVVYSSGSIISTPVPAPILNTSLPIEVIIAQTSSAAQTQTVQAAPLPTATLAPSNETIPTATVFISVLQTSAAQPTEYIYYTNTPFSLATPTLEAIQPTLPPQSAVCSCSGDTLNCGDFSSHSSAQACFNYCISQGRGDIHRLDGNNDGTACE